MSICVYFFFFLYRFCKLSVVFSKTEDRLLPHRDGKTEICCQKACTICKFYHLSSSSSSRLSLACILNLRRLCKILVPNLLRILENILKSVDENTHRTVRRSLKHHLSVFRYRFLYHNEGLFAFPFVINRLCHNRFNGSFILYFIIFKLPIYFFRVLC